MIQVKQGQLNFTGNLSIRELPHTVYLNGWTYPFPTF
jgi:hypothetical protein